MFAGGRCSICEFGLGASPRKAAQFSRRAARRGESRDLAKRTFIPLGHAESLGLMAMRSTVSFLHLSDLHRSPEQPFSNAEMMAALRSDRDRWRSEGVADPDFVLISGDVVQGERLGEPNFEEKIEDQYSEAFAFLVELAETFLDGSRERMVIVPGNHDVCWNTAMASMTPVVGEKFDEVSKQIRWSTVDPRSPYRWDWQSRKIYEVADPVAYAGRCAAFYRFRSRFYEDCEIDPLAIHRDMFFMDYPEFDLTITGLSSWFGNDCFCHVGAVDPELVVAAQSATSASSAGLHLAVWHHSLDGPPGASDYLDRGLVHQLIDYGLRVGFHGHQHRGDAISVDLRLPTSERFAAVSAGSFAAWGRDLPSGVARQYNIVEIDVPSSTVKVHVRESIGTSIFAGSRRTDLGGLGAVELEYSPRPGQRSLAVREMVVLDQATTLHKEGDSKGALELVKKNNLDSGLGRLLTSEILFQEEEFEELAVHLQNPESVDELMLAVNALCELAQFDSAEQTLQAFVDSHQSLGTIERDLRAEIEKKKAGL